MICPACNKETDNIVKHHWYELPNLELHTIDICDSCNGVLTTKRFYPEYYSDHKEILHHVLPTWEVQLAYLRNGISRQCQSNNRIRTSRTKLCTYRIPEDIVLFIQEEARRLDISESKCFIQMLKHGLNEEDSNVSV